MKAVSIRTAAPGSADAIDERVRAAAAVLGGYTVARDASTIVVERQETAWWLLGIFAPLFRRRHQITITVDGDTVAAHGHADAAMVGFLEAYLLGAERPALSPRLREIAAR